MTRNQKQNGLNTLVVILAQAKEEPKYKILGGAITTLRYHCMQRKQKKISPPSPSREKGQAWPNDLIVQSYQEQSSINLCHLLFICRKDTFFYQYKPKSHHRLRIIYTKAMMSKMLCKFKENCKNYKDGKPCNFSHDKCKFGKTCKNIQNCKYFHEPDQPSSKSMQKHDKPMGEVQCKFGAKCTRRLEGKCFFSHSEVNNPTSMFIEPRKDEPRIGISQSQTLCKHGDRCTYFPLGKCPYKHQQSSTNPSQPKNHLIVLDSLCLKFLTNNQCQQGCSKIHEYSATKTITKIFTVSNCGRTIKKIMILQPYQPDQQPLYIIVGDNRIIFGQLTNLAKQSGNQNISSNSLVMKRWCDRDIHFEGDEIYNAWLIKAQSQSHGRADILTIKCRESVRIIVINRQKMAVFPIHQNIKSVIFISNALFILTDSKKTFAFQFDFGSAQFRQVASPITEPLNFLKKHHKSIQNQQFAAGATADGRLCFINSKFQTFSVNLKENIKDVCITEYSNLPVALALTQLGNIFAINLLTFESVTLLHGNVPEGLACSSLTLTFDHLLLAIDGFGVLVYHFEQFDKAIGVLALGNHKWTIQCNQKGNVALLSEDSHGKVDANIFKLRRL